MASSKIKGIIVEIGGDTSGLQKALEKANSASTKLQKELKQINKDLKFDPKNTELLAQKQNVLKQNIQETSKVLRGLQQAQKEYIQSGGNLNTEEYRTLQREIIETENKLKNLKLEASNWTKASQSLQQFSDKMKNLGNTITNIGNKFMGLTAVIGTGGILGVKYNAQLEQYQTALTTLTGSEEKAAKIMEQIEKDAAKTPFDVSGLTQANQLLISTGLSAGDARKTILALGNAVSASGGGDDELSRMAVNLQQIKNVGKATALDIKQFAYAGIDIYGLLADYLGISKKEAADMTVSWDDLNGALLHASKKGGKYFGSMEKQSETVNGKISNLKDSFNRFVGALTETFVPTIKKVIDKVTELFEKFNSLDDETKSFAGKIALLVAAIGPALVIIGKIITAGGTIVGVFSKVAGIIAKVSSSAGGLSGILSTLTGPVGIVIAAIGALVGVFVYLFNTNETFKSKVMETWNNIVKLFQETIIPAFNRVKDAVMSSLQIVFELWQNLWAKLEPLVTEALMWFMDFWNNTLKDVVTNVINFVVRLIEEWSHFYNEFIAPIIKVLLEKLWPVVELVFRNVGAIVGGVFETVGKVINNIIGILDGLITFITRVFSGDWKKAWEGVSKIFRNIVEGLWQIIKMPLNWIIDGINNLIRGLNGVKVPDWVPFVGGKSINLPTIPRLAKGGIVDQATLAMIGEGKSAEAVIPLDRTLTKYMAEAMRQAGGTGTITVNFYPQKMTEAELDNAFNYINNRFGMAY